MDKQFFCYIITNIRKKTLYVGMTNDLEIRIMEHYQNRGEPKTFAGRYYCFYLLWFERFESAQDAIDREKQIKKWSRWKKEALIKESNPEMRFLNKQLTEWPPVSKVNRNLD